MEDKSQVLVIKGYCTENGLFNASEFMEELLKNQQKIIFSGAGSPHYNGASYCAIKIVVTMARTTLINAAVRCPEEKLSTDIWPMAMDYAVWVYNRIPDMQYGLSAIEICSRSRIEPVS